MDDPSWWRLNKGAPTADDTGMRNTYDGFTLKELSSLGAFPHNTHSKTLLNNLENIHPIFSQDNWEDSIPARFAEKRKPCPLGRDQNNNLQDGDWTAHNPLVWKVLEPSLKLTSKFIENAHIFPWYDALIHGVKKTGQPELPNRRNFLDFYYRSEQYLNTPESEKSTREFMAKISQSISFGISDSDIDPRTGEEYPKGERHYSVNLPPWEDAEGISRIWLAYQAILPIMQDDIPKKIRLTYQVDIALIILREFAHIVTYSVRQTLRQRPELKCEGDLEFQPGLSFDVATFGGHFRPVAKSQGGLTPRCYILEGWAGTKNSPGRQLPVAPAITAKDGSTTSQYRAIPFFYLEDLFQEEFWKYFVKKWGAEALRIYPLTEGRIVQRKDRQLQNWMHLTVPRESPQWVTEAKNISSKDLTLLKIEERTAFKIAEGRIRRARKIAETARVNKTKSVLRSNQEGSPQSIREQRLRVQRTMLIKHKYSCRARVEEVDRFLRSTEIGTVEYKKTKKDLIERNRVDRVDAMTWKGVAEDEDLAEEYQKIFDRYEKIKAVIAPEYKQTLQPPGQDTYPGRTAQEWEALLRTARESLGENGISEATKICREITKDVEAPNGTVADAFLLLASENKPDRLWNAKQAIQMFDLIKSCSGNEPDPHIDGKLGAARTLMQKARNEIQPKRLKTLPLARVQSAKSKNTRLPVSSRTSGKDRLKVQTWGQGKTDVQHTNSTKTEIEEKGNLRQTGSTPLETVQREQAQKIETAKETEEAEEIEVLGIPRNYGWRPKVRPNVADPTPKTQQEESQIVLYDEAYATRKRGDYSSSERIFLSLLQMRNLNAYTKALCHVQLATLAHRTDQAEHARRAQLIFMQLELAQPDSRRAAADRLSADCLMRTVERAGAAREKERQASWSLTQGLWSLLGWKRKRGDGEEEDDAVREVASAIVDSSGDGSSPKKARYS